MKLKFTFLITVLLMLGNLTTWGQTQTTFISGSGTSSNSYTLPEDWIVTGTVVGGSYIKFDEGTLTSPVFNPHNDISFTYSVATFGSGTNHPLTVRILDESNNVISTYTTATPTSNSYITTGSPLSLGSITYNFKIQLYGPSAKGVRLRNFSITGTPAPTGPTQLTAPTDFSGIPGNGQIAFSWTAVEHASSYTISYTPEGGTEQTQAVTGATTSSYTLTGLTNYVEYSCKIKAVGDGTTFSDSDYTTAISVEPTDATLYTITLNESAGGTITCDKTTAEAGETITLTATPADGYGFTSWTVLDGGANEVTVTDNQFTMPASNVEVEATFTAYIISATSNDPSLGSVSLSGNVITATAATGCRINAATPYEVTVGTATVTQNDNEFTVVATSDCTVQINFEAIPTYTVSFNAGTGTVSPTSLNGATIDFSTLTVTPPTGWTFYGWATASVEATQTTPTIISGTTYTPTDNITLYAVYSKSEGSDYVEFIPDDFNSSSYNNNNGIHSKNTNGGKVYNYYTNQIMLSNSVMQWQKNNAYMYNEGNMGTISSIEITSSDNYLTVYAKASTDVIGVAVDPSSTSSHYIYTFTGDNSYFKITNGNGTSKTTSVKVIFSTTTYNTNPAAYGPCAMPTFSLDEGYYYAAQSVELSCETTGATICYTIDGTEPTAESTVYDSESPITLSTTTTIKAKAYCNGYDPSAIATATYNFMPDVAGTYVIAYKEGENYYAMSQTANEYGTKLTSQAVTLNGDGKVVTSVNGGLLWTIANTTNGVEIKPFNTTNYLNIGSGTLTIGTTEDYFQVISRLEEVYSFKDMTSNYAVEYYNGFFTGYSYSETDPFNFYLLPYELPVTYTISIAEGISNGSISSVTSASEGDEITVTVNPDTDYKLSTLYYYTTDPATTTPIDQNTLKFNMPAANVTIGATFEPILYWQITLSENGVPFPTLISVQQGLSTILPASENVPDGYTFVGWSTTDVGVTNTEPELVATEFTPEADTTLYAVYTLEGKYTLVTDASTLAAGDVLVIASNSKGLCAGDINDEVMGIVDCTFSDDNSSIQTLGTGVVELTLGGTSEAWTLANNGELLGATAVKKLAWNSGTTTWTISIDNNAATIQNGTSSFGRFLHNVSSTRFTTYTSGTSISMLLPQLYRKYKTNYTTTVDVLAENTEITTNTTYTNPTSLGNQTLTIQSGVVLTATNGLGNTNAANLIIEDGGQLIINNSGIQATAKKNIVAWTNDNPDTPENETSGWYSISSPVKGLRLDSIFGAPQTGATTTTVDLYSYDEPTYTWNNYHNNSISESTLIPGKGYLTANASLTTREFVGELNNGEIIVNLSYESTHAPIRGFNFVGNPYLQDITLGDQAIVSESVATGYYKLVGGVFLARENNITIAPKEGFFVRATAVDQTITFNNAPTRSKDRANKDQYISIEVNNNTYMDCAYAMFSDVIGLAKVSHLDENAPMVYIPQNGTDYAIASYTDDVNEIPLCFKTPTTGYYTISMKPQGEFNYIHLFDKVENVEIDMLNRGSYEFIGSPKDMENRFTITLNRVNTPNNTVINNFAFISNNELVINNIEGEGTIQIIDIVGRVASQYIVSGSTRISMDELSKGVYMVRLIDNAGSKTQKIVVK